MASLSRSARLAWPFVLIWVVVAFAAWCLVGAFFYESITRPLQTLSNIVFSLREEDYSFRARGARRDDALGDLALEINTLASTLQRQRNSAMEALALADSVISSMPSPLLAFDLSGSLRLLNAAAEHALHLDRRTSLGANAAVLHLDSLTTLPDGAVYTVDVADRWALESTSVRWSVRRSSFRLGGVPHTLFVLSDVGAALREEERLAWKRLIRVLGHEINNSLTPIKTIASMLRCRPTPLLGATPSAQDAQDFHRGLAVIEDRADSLNRFLQAYQQLSRLPPPTLQQVDLLSLIERTVPLETRVEVAVAPSPAITLHIDPDQIQQVLINLLKNAADAALHPDASGRTPSVSLRWSASGSSFLLQVIDSGPGIANPENLFVPFYTTKQAGAGIGLTLSRQIIAAHHGTLTLENRRDTVGCAAYISLPLQYGQKS